MCKPHNHPQGPDDSYVLTAVKNALRTPLHVHHPQCVHRIKVNGKLVVEFETPARTQTYVPQYYTVLTPKP